MITVRKTKKGWVFCRDAYSAYYGANVSGQLTGTETLIYTADLEKNGVKYDDDPDGPWQPDYPGVSVKNWVYATIVKAGMGRTLKKGHIVQ